MRKLRDLIRKWEETNGAPLTANDYTIKLTLHDAARIEALASMYPRAGVAGVLSDLLSASLDELESSLPYVPGNHVIEYDECGDPIYEDIGPGRSFHRLTEQFEAELPTQN